MHTSGRCWSDMRGQTAGVGLVENKSGGEEVEREDSPR